MLKPTVKVQERRHIRAIVKETAGSALVSPSTAFQNSSHLNDIPMAG
jgi:hypothetical protein